ncbi:MAG TPA: ribbon-helix-helix protein, CopG family [Thermoanaerobaculia bacterium]
MQIEIDLPDEVLERLEKKAAASGMSVSQYFVRYLEQIAAVPTEEEMIERLRNLPPVKTTRDPVDVIREVRDGVGI